jgi:hypothetical protein
MSLILCTEISKSHQNKRFYMLQAFSITSYKFLKQLNNEDLIILLKHVNNP